MFSSCFIRLVDPHDLRMLLDWRNNIDVRRFMFNQHEIGFDEHFDWFNKATVDPKRRLMIVEEANIPIGYVQFSNVTNGGAADWGFYARPDSPKGTGRKLGAVALDYAFGDLELHKVCGQAIDTNIASISLHKSLGFTQEGILRDQQRIDQKFYNLIYFGILANEWLSCRDKYGSINAKN